MLIIAYIFKIPVIKMNRRAATPEETKAEF